MEADQDKNLQVWVEAPAVSPFDTQILDLFTSYGLSPAGLSNEEIHQLSNTISQTKKTFSCLQEAIHSNRYPYTIMTLAAKVGMYIPPRKRVGISAYQFFIHNIKYYEATFDRAGQQVPNRYEIYISKDRIGLLMKFRDDEILRPGYKFSVSYSDRREMIENFLTNNIEIFGEFKLDSNSRRVYSSKAKVIIYTEGTLKLTYSITDLLKMVDLQRKVIWKYPEGFTNPDIKYAFSQFCLLKLRQDILEKFDQWRHKEFYSSFNQSSVPNELYRFIISLESILGNEVRVDTSAYLGNPVLAC